VGDFIDVSARLELKQCVDENEKEGGMGMSGMGGRGKRGAESLWWAATWWWL